MNKYIRGFSLIELLVSIGAISLIFALGIPGISGFLSRIEIQSGVRTVTSSMNYARYSSIEINRKIKYAIEDFNIVLKIRKNNKWQGYKKFKFNKSVSVKINSFPVFYPTGRVAPLCTVYVSSQRYLYKITISIAGRIKTTKL